MAKARLEMQAIIAEQRINQALRSKLPPAASYAIKPGQQARVYREKERCWDGPFHVLRVKDKIITVRIGKDAKQFNKSHVLPIPDHPDKEMERLLKGISQFNTETPRIQIIEIIKKRRSALHQGQGKCCLRKRDHRLNFQGCVPCRSQKGCRSRREYPRLTFYPLHKGYKHGRREVQSPIRRPGPYRP